MSITVTVAYGAIEYAFMRTTGFFIGVSWYLDLLGWGIHVVPQILQMTEWWYSSIPIQYTRLPVYYFVMVCYSVLNSSFGEKGVQLYESAEWINNPKMTSIGIGLIWVTYGLMYVALKELTDFKLKKGSLLELSINSFL